jgi:hypothetical protein
MKPEDISRDALMVYLIRHRPLVDSQRAYRTTVLDDAST